MCEGPFAHPSASDLSALKNEKFCTFSRPRLTPSIATSFVVTSYLPPVLATELRKSQEYSGWTGVSLVLAASPCRTRYRSGRSLRPCIWLGQSLSSLDVPELPQPSPNRSEPTTTAAHRIFVPRDVRPSFERIASGSHRRRRGRLQAVIAAKPCCFHQKQKTGERSGPQAVPRSIRFQRHAA